MAPGLREGDCEKCGLWNLVRSSWVSGSSQFRECIRWLRVESCCNPFRLETGRLLVPILSAGARASGFRWQLVGGPDEGLPSFSSWLWIPRRGVADWTGAWPEAAGWASAVADPFSG